MGLKIKRPKIHIPSVKHVLPPVGSLLTRPVQGLRKVVKKTHPSYGQLLKSMRHLEVRSGLRNKSGGHLRDGAEYDSSQPFGGRGRGRS